MKKIIFFLYQWIIFMPLFVVLTLITALIVIITTPIFGGRFWGYYPPMIWSRLTCRIALCRIKTKGLQNLDPKQSYIFIANHQGAFDIFLTYGFLNHNIIWMQKQGLRNIPFVGYASEKAGHVFVDNSSPGTRARSIKKAEENITDGVSMVIFPEGSRTLSGKMGKFKKGAFHIARDLNLPIVPITLNGPYDVMKRGTYNIIPGPLELIVHKPIPMDNITEEQLPHLISTTREIIHSALWEKYKD
ncbi:MAG: lysophospholipid acyltransferase family protein [Fermentimonas sp.]